MRRRNFLLGCGSMAVWGGGNFLAKAGHLPFPQATRTPSIESLVGERANLAGFGGLKSWINPEVTPLLPREVVLGRSPTRILRLSDMTWQGSEFDVGVEWPEYRTVEKVVIRYTAENKAPRPDKQFLEYWRGLTARQGAWYVLEDWLDRPAEMEIDGATWTYTFVPGWLTFKLSPVRTCKIRLRLQEQRQTEIASFEVYGPARWKCGEVRIEWGHSGSERSYDGHLDAYNAEVLEIRPLDRAQLKDDLSWSSVAGNGKVSGIVAKILYTTGQDVDRSVLTLRMNSGDISFVLAEALEEEPIDIADYGIYIRNATSDLDYAAYRRKNSGKSRICDLVLKHPEQGLENAYEHLKPPRTRLSFVGVDCNNQKFGIRPDGHVVVGYTDPANGKVVRPPAFAVHFASAEEAAETQAASAAKLFVDKDSRGITPKDQHLEEGWLPIIVTNWTTETLSFERTDYAALLQTPDGLDESNLVGTESAVMISRLKIRNDSPIARVANYYIRPWKPMAATLEGWESPLSDKLENGFQTGIRESCVTGIEGNFESVVCLVDKHGRGSLSLEQLSEAVRYAVKLGPGEEHTIHTVIPGWPVAAGEFSRLSGLPYEHLYDAAVRYWKARLAEGMQVQLPDLGLQNLYNASLHHFLLAMTKDAKRGEYYPHVAMFTYGAIGSESGPIIQALDMRGMHQHAEKCLQAFLSEQGYFMCDGDSPSKEGSFCRFWPAYSINQGAVLWTLAEHYLYTRDKNWLRKVAPQIVSGCDYLIRERKRAMIEGPGGRKPLTYGLAPAGCVADMRDWQYSFMLNGYYYLGLKKSAQVLQEIDPENAKRIATDADQYLTAIKRVLKESISISPVTRLRDGTSVPSVPPFPGLRGFRSEVKDAPEIGYGAGYAYDVELGALHLLKTEVLEPHDREIAWMLNSLEDRFFMVQPSTKHLELLGTDWFNLGGFARMQPYYLHYQDAYLQRDEIPNFLRGFFNTAATSADPYTLTFMEGAFGGGAPHKTHEEAWFFHQLRFMLLMEMGEDLFLARGTPRRWLEDGQNIGVSRARSYFGELSYTIESFSNEGRIAATVNPPRRNPPRALYLRLRHPKQLPLKRVTVNGQTWKGFDAGKEWIKLSADSNELKIIAYY